WAFARGLGVGDRAGFVAADVARLPFEDATFDAAAVNDAMEHFSKPAEVLGELARAVRPGGRLFVTFPPFFSPWGAHLYDSVRLPWCQVFLSRQSLGRLVERAVAEREPSPDRAREIATQQLEFFDRALNRMTVS